MINLFKTKSFNVFNVQASLNRKILLNFVGYGYGQVVSIFQQFLLIPLYLSLWGTTQYADWLILSGVVSLFGMLDMGVTGAAASRATMLASGDDWVRARKILHSGLVFSWVVAFFGTVFSVIFVKFLDLKSILHISTISRDGVDLAIVGLAAILGVQIIGGALESIYRTIDRAAIGYFLLANRGVVTFILSVIILLLHANIIVMIFVLLAGHILYLCFIVFRLYILLQDKSLLGVGEASWAEFLAIWLPALSNVGLAVAQMISLQGTVQMVNQVADARTVVWVSLVRTFVRLVIQLGVVMNMAMRPEIARMTGEGRTDEADKATRHLWTIVGIVATIFYVGTVIVGPSFIFWWSHNTIHVSIMAVGLIGLHALLNVLWYIPAGNLIAKNEHNKIGIVYPLASIASLLVWWVLEHKVKPEFGVAFALGMPEFIMLVWMYVHSRHLFYLKSVKYG